MQRDTHRSEVRKTGDGAVTVGEGGGDEEVNETAEDEEWCVRVLARGEVGLDDGVCDAGELPDVPARQLDAADVRVLQPNLRDDVGIEVNTASGAGDCKKSVELKLDGTARRTVVDYDGDRALLSDLAEERLQCWPVVRECAREVTARDNDRVIRARVLCLMTELDRLARAACTRACHDRHIGEPCLVQSAPGGLDERAPLCVRQVDRLPHRPCDEGPDMRLCEAEEVGDEWWEILGRNDSEYTRIAANR